jgi:hypothetical protein
MFQMGLGGEFTATSMIGWIALAGIIVRNSILLVDFSIHEIQRGIPVAESVIRACKIRTRPILITALALVAGSSVIITDPIFQGMAISLLAGTLVSTVLTLIVIPLGCVAASRDMCEVAAASAEHLPTSGLPCQVEAAQQQAAKPAREGGGLTGALVKVGEVLSLVFFALRGIGLLLLDLAKNAFKPKPPKRKPQRPQPAPRPAAPAAAPAVAESQPAGAVAPMPEPVAEPNGERVTEPAARAEPTAAASAPEAMAETSPEVRPAPETAVPPEPEPAPDSVQTQVEAQVQEPVQAELEGPVQAQVRVEETTDGSASAQAPLGPTEPPQDPEPRGLSPYGLKLVAPAESAASPAPAVAQDAPAIPAERPTAQPTPQPAAKPKNKPASGKSGGGGKGTGADKRPPAKQVPGANGPAKPAPSPVVQNGLVQKKAPRRGIRLKIDGADGDDN